MATSADPPHFEIRVATEQDTSAILHCLHEAFEPFRRFYPREGYADSTLTSETIGPRMREMRVFVAETAERDVIGTVACQVLSKQEGHLRGMAVLSHLQGSGVATALLRAAEAFLAAQCCEFISLDTTAPLKRAIAFYVRNGYSASGKVGDFYGMPLYQYVKRL